MDTLPTIRHNLTCRKLEDARSDHSNAKQKNESHVEDVRGKGQAFQKEQGDIDRRLLIVTESETSDEAVEKFESSMANLRKLDIATGYIELLKEVDGLRSESVSQLDKSDEAALEPYKRLQHLVTSLQPLQEAAEGAAPHLLDHIAHQVQQVRTTIQSSFAADFDSTLKKMNWPKDTKIRTVPMALQQEWNKNVGRLLKLQRQDLEDSEQNAEAQSNDNEPPVLLPIEVMVRPIEQRFTFHFSGNKNTNRLDKPEYFFSHATDIISDHSDLLDNALQPLLIQHFRGSDLAFTPAYIDATTAFISGLLPMLKRKVQSVASQVSSQPQLLSHLVHEVMSFDTTLQETFAYSPASPSIPWRGLAYFLLDTCGYFDQWLAAERDFALSRYQAIIDTPDSKELDYDSVSYEATKPTKAAIRVNDLLDTITERYRTLASFSQKLRFLIDIQIAIFDQFLGRLRSSLEAYLTMTSSIGRRMQGVSKDDQTELHGVKGLDHLCRVFGSAEYLERAMRDWSDDVFFLELWEELQERVRTRDRVSRNLGELQEIKQKTSAAVGDDENNGELQGALFDETATSYQNLRIRSEGVLVETLTYNIREALRPYARIATWASLSSTTASGAISAELEPTLRLLSEYFGFLSKAIGRTALRRLSRQVAHSIQSFIWDNVLTRHSFSTAGAMRLSVDVSAICGNIDSYVGNGQARLGMRKLVEGVALISLPIRSEIPRVQQSSSGDDEDTAAWEDTNGHAEEADSKKMGLFEAERLVFMDNESARHALEQLGLESLSESDARAVLEKRIELGS